MVKMTLARQLAEITGEPLKIDTGTANKPATNPAPRDGTQWGYKDYQAPLFGGSQKVQASDVVQAGSHVADCYMLSDLQALAGLNSDFIKNHVKQIDNPNDAAHPNYQVTLYKDGEPVNIVVDGKQMLDKTDGADQGAGAGAPDMKQGASTSLWPSVYEKAYAIATSSMMNELDVDSPTEAWTVLTGAGSATDFMPKDGAKFADAVSQQKNAGGGVAMSTVDNVTDIPGWDTDSSTASFGNGRYAVQRDSLVSVRVTDTQSPTQESWSVPLGHIMNVKSVTSFDSKQPDPTKVTDNSKLSVDVENPFGPSVTNQANLQSLPYDVMQAMSKSYVTLDAPDSNKK